LGEEVNAQPKTPKTQTRTSTMTSDEQRKRRTPAHENKNITHFFLASTHTHTSHPSPPSPVPFRDSPACPDVFFFPHTMSLFFRRTLADVPALNRHSRLITQPKDHGASQAMLYATDGIHADADFNKPLVGVASVW